MKNNKRDPLHLPTEVKIKIEVTLSSLPKQQLDWACIAINGWFDMAYKSIFEGEIRKADYCRLYCHHLWIHIKREKEFNDFTEAVKKLLKMLSIDARPEI